MSASRLAGAAVVSVLAFAAFAPALATGFVYDDFSVVSENPELHSLLKARNYFTPDYFRRAGETTYRPLVTASYALDYAFWGRKAFGYHLTNLGWHVAACVAFFLMCSSLGAKREVSLAAAAIFAVHPVRSEAVAAIGFREDLLCAAFYFAALALWPTGEGKAGQSAAQPGQDDGGAAPSQWPRFLGAMVLYALALLSKEMALSFPFLALAKDLRSRAAARAISAGQNRIAPPALRSTLIRHAVLWCATLSFLALFLTFTHPDPPPRGRETFGLLTRLGAFSWISLRYLGLLLVPYPLSIEYATEMKGPFFWRTVAGSVAAICLLGALAWRLRGRFPAALESFLAFYVLLGPVSNLIPISNPMAERYLTIPAAAFAWFAGHWLGSIPRRRARRTSTALLIAIYAALSWVRLQDWRDSVRLWSKAIEQGSETARTLGNLGDALVAQGRRDEALDLFRRAAEADPADLKPYSNIARVYYEKKDFAKAAEVCENALRRHAGFQREGRPSVSPGSGGAPAAPEQDHRVARREDKESVAALHNSLGNALFQMGKYEEARRRYEEARKAFPHLRGLDNNMGNVMLRLGRADDAVVCYEKAIEQQPDWALARRNLGFALWQLGRYDEAAEQYRAALRLKPDWGAVRAEFARLLAERDRAAMR